MHLRIAFPSRFLRRGRCGNDRCIDDHVPSLSRSPLAEEVDVDRRKDALGQLVRFEQAPEFEQGRRIRCRLGSGRCQQSRESLGCRTTRLPSLRRKVRNIAARCTCATCVQDRSADDHALRLSGRTAEFRRPAPTTASLPRSRQETDLAASSSFSPRIPVPKNSITASSFLVQLSTRSFSHPVADFNSDMGNKSVHPQVKQIHQSMVRGNQVSQPAISSMQIIAIILAKAVVRLIHRQKLLDSPTDQSVHDCVLVTKGETL